MDLSLDEQKLVAGFRELDADGRTELLGYAAQLVREYRNRSESGGTHSDNQCKLETRTETRPEAAKEPIFTE